MHTPARLAPARSRTLAILVAALFASLASACSKSSDTPAPPASSTFTLHYHRAQADYAGWTVNPTSGAVETTVSPSATSDDFGSIYALTLTGGATTLAFTIQKGAEADTAGNRLDRRVGFGPGGLGLLRVAERRAAQAPGDSLQHPGGRLLHAR